MTQDEAPKKSVSLVGRRLAAVRRWRGMTAEQLAEAIPSSDITRGVIANVESGRKRDLTATELALVASGLDVSPIALLVDMSSPFEPVALEGLADGYAGLTNVEYLFATSIYAPENAWHGLQIPNDARALMTSLLRAEGSLKQVQAIEDARSDRGAFAAKAAEDARGSVRHSDGPLHSFGVTAEMLSDDFYRAYVQDLIDDYRDLLQRVPGGMWDWNGLRVPPNVEARIEEIRRRVVLAMEDDPTLDRSSSRRPASEDPRRVAHTVVGPIIDESGAPVGSNHRSKLETGEDGKTYRLIYMEGDPDAGDDGSDVEEYRGE
ncbi:helix-turn-helix domain-containing protein [Plantibacter flavus]|uniref:helix-turn-helix domain-containing protein n=1 Tax=Plantibacter flavus TaxID=150123 RepID=UPI00129463E9|nr:helix-turn-helix transcriptional regulator [Plantibacter flavus]